MFKNYFKTAFRSLLRNKGFSTLNILGLAIGMASALLIMLWVVNETSTNRFFKKADRSYVLYNRGKGFDGVVDLWQMTPNVLGTTLKQDYPEVEDMTRYSYYSFLFTVGEKKLYANGGFVDSGFLKMFDFPLAYGNATNALTSNNSIVLTEKLSKQLFGNANPVGKTVKIDSSDLFTVSAVLKDLPSNTTFNFDYLLPWNYREKLGWESPNWTNNFCMTYITLTPGTELNRFNNKIKNITIEHTKGSKLPSNYEVNAYPFTKSYLYDKVENGKYVAGHGVMVRLFGVVAGIILLIACINFMNLSTARSEKRAKEVGVRKVVGARKASLVGQFLMESVLISLCAYIIALGIALLVLPFYNHLIGKELTIPIENIYFILFSIGFILFTGLLAGSYPAFFLSAFNPVKVLKGTYRKAQSRVNPRSVLVVVQFTFAIVLIVSTIIISRQIHYIQSRDRGYNKDALLYSLFSGDMEKNYPVIRQELISSGAVTSVSKTMSPITERWSRGIGYSWTGSNEKSKMLSFDKFASDADLVKTLNLTLLEGRDINIYNYPADSNAVLLNETAIKKMGLTHPIGTKLTTDWGEHWKVVGVIKDFIIESPTDNVAPMMIYGPMSWFGAMHYRLNPAHPIAENLKKIESIFKKYNPDYPFDYKFTDAIYAEKFVNIERTGTLTNLFSGLTIFISCLGLFGLAAYMAEARTKEIGVRKVLGASVASITTLLSKDFLKLVIIALVIAIPIAWYVSVNWLQNYEYRINVPIWAFALAGLLSITIALLTVGILSLRAARANPVKSLRTE
ncbi:MAG: ABC transporter permease [Chitinophagaceae bacterium]